MARLLPHTRLVNVMWPVSGLEKPVRALSVANVRFDVLRAGKRNALLRQMADGGDRAARKAMAEYLKHFEGPHVYAQVAIPTRDVQAAEEMARQRIRLVLEVLNFFVDMEVGLFAAIYIQGDIGSQGIGTLAYDLKGTPPLFPSLRLSRQGPFLRASLKRLKRRPGFATAERLIAKQKLSDAEARVLRAVRWAGRATVERDPGHSLTFFVFALESLLIGPQAAGDIGYRLAVRGAHLLSKDKSGKKKTFDHIRHLYSLRSDVAHRGKLDAVAEKDRFLARNYSKAAIMSLLPRKALLRRISADKDMNDWLDNRVL